MGNIAQQMTFRQMADQQAAITAGYQLLAREVVQAAIRDAMRGKEGYTRDMARHWLISPDGRAFAEFSGLDVELINRWAAAGFPLPEKIPRTMGHRVHDLRNEGETDD